MTLNDESKKTIPDNLKQFEERRKKLRYRMWWSLEDIYYSSKFFLEDLPENIKTVPYILPAIRIRSNLDSPLRSRWIVYKARTLTYCEDPYKKCEDVLSRGGLSPVFSEKIPETNWWLSSEIYNITRRPIPSLAEYKEDFVSMSIKELSEKLIDKNISRLETPKKITFEHHPRFGLNIQVNPVSSEELTQLSVLIMDTYQKQGKRYRFDNWDK